MQFQVPQFIETEDKIIGPLSLRQFLFLAAGFGCGFIFYFLVQLWLWIALMIFFVGGSAALAFVNVNGKTLAKVLSSAATFYWNPRTYVWQPKQPALPKTSENIGPTKEGFSIEKVVAGMALKSAWRYLQTGSKAPEEQKPAEEQIKTKEVYQAFREITGERRIAKRVDYR